MVGSSRVSVGLVHAALNAAAAVPASDDQRDIASGLSERIERTVDPASVFVARSSHHLVGYARVDGVLLSYNRTTSDAQVWVKSGIAGWFSFADLAELGKILAFAEPSSR